MNTVYNKRKNTWLIFGKDMYRADADSEPPIIDKTCFFRTV